LLAVFGATAALVVMTTATAAVASPTANTAGPPTHNGVQPTYNRGNITTCPAGITFINTADGGPGDRDASYSNDGTTFVTTISRNGTYLSFTTNSLSFTIYIKGGPAYDTYNYPGTVDNPAPSSDGRLHAPYNGGGQLPDIGHYLVCGQPASEKATPKLVTSPSAGGAAGSVVLNDMATLSDGASPTGAITFSLYPPSDPQCTGTPVYTTDVTISGNGKYFTANSSPANASGTWNWTATYPGDSNNNGASSGCTHEMVNVGEAAPTLSTTATTTPGTGTTVGTAVLNDTATLSGAVSPTGMPTGTITFDLYAPGDATCAGPVVYSEPVTVSGNGSYSTSNTTPANIAGAWKWTASYSGDANNNSATSDCMESFTVDKATPSLSTTPGPGGAAGSVMLNDTGNLAGGYNPTGSITFSLYAPGDTTCAGPVQYSERVSVSGDGSYPTKNTTFVAELAGTWHWTASYSGDSNNNQLLESDCQQETVTVTKGTPIPKTVPTSGGAQGSVVLNDTATLSGGATPRTGTVTFSLYGPADPQCQGPKPAYTETVSMSADGSYSTTNTARATIAGTWHWIATYNGDDNNNSVSSACADESVTVTPVTAQASCQASGSLSTLVSGTNVISYIPKGSWDAFVPGIAVVNVEGTSVTNTTIDTGTDVINSCASNSVTGETVCTANNNDVWILNGTGLDPAVSNPLKDAGVGVISFSGGSATTTGVAIDTTDNKALIGLSLGGVGGFQFLDLATHTFEDAFASKDPTIPGHPQISEDPVIDSVHHLILSAAEDNNYELINVSTTTAPGFFEHQVQSVPGELDSSAEDCSTGIMLAPVEASSSQIEIADISNPGSPPQAVFTPGSPGTWTAPEQIQTLTGSNLTSGPSGAAVAEGTHTGVVSGEFGGDSLTALALPTTSGTGATPAISNWVSCSTGPDPSGKPFVMGDDPHTLAAYQSPNGGDAIALMVNKGATEMVRVDLTAMLNPKAVPATGNVCNAGILPSSAETFIPLPQP
jgi:hypothetical protein